MSEWSNLSDRISIGDVIGNSMHFALDKMDITFEGSLMTSRDRNINLEMDVLIRYNGYFSPGDLYINPQNNSHRDNIKWRLERRL